jgi:hypothetical protein
LKATYSARPRLFNERKWRTDNHKHVGETGVDFQMRIDTAPQRWAEARQEVIASYRPVEAILQEQQRLLVNSAPAEFDWEMDKFSKLENLRKPDILKNFQTFHQVFQILPHGVPRSPTV